MPYDYGSIMHYSSEAFSKQWGKKTIVPKVFTIYTGHNL